MSTYDLHRRITEAHAAPPTQISAKLAALLPEQPAYHALEAIAPQPTLRIRVEHSRTVKDGWSYSTTVEMDGIDASDYQRIDEAVQRIAITLEDVFFQRDNAAKEATAQIASPAS